MKSPKTQRGMMLLEALIAILIFSFGILGIVGLQAATLRYASDAKYRLDASYLANQSIGSMWGDRSNLAAHAVTNEAIPSLPNGKRTITVSGTEVTVTLTWKLPGETTGHTYAIISYINGLFFEDMLICVA
jgi:type IV pilus assembly protein PilV